MGKFARAVQRQSIPGPNRRDFDRSYWALKVSDPASDTDDVRVASAGLILHSLLEHIRARQVRDRLGLAPELLIRGAVAIVNNTHRELMETAKEVVLDPGQGPISTADILKPSLENALGQIVHPDETSTSLGDGL